jgi:nucleoside-diphosphate-sugar epimerase
MKYGNNHVLVTGATGFVGSSLCLRLLAEGLSVRGTLLEGESPSALAAGVQPVIVASLGCDTPWEKALEGIDTIIHLAARVHVMNDQCADPLEEYRVVNVVGTLKLARDAVRQGVRRFVFISSIKVNGEESAEPYSPGSPPCPRDPYGISKWEAEQGLRLLAQGSGLEVVIVRPTLVYGPGVKGNFLTLLKILLRGGLILPFASINNVRSLLYLGNLVDALALCAVHPAAAGQTYLLSDGEDVSTPELLRRCAAALGVPLRLVPFPVRLMLWAGKLIGREGALRRLTGTLAVDSSGIRRELGWTPPFSMEQGLGITAAWYQRHSLTKPRGR